MNVFGACILAAALIGGTAPAASALPVGGAGGLLRSTPSPGEAGQPRISPAEAAARARQRYGGKVLDVSLERYGARPHYRVKLLRDGNVRSVRVPAD